MRVTVYISRADYNDSGTTVHTTVYVEMDVAHFKDVLSDSRVLKNARKLTPNLLERIQLGSATIDRSGKHYSWTISNESEQQMISVWNE